MGIVASMSLEARIERLELHNRLLRLTLVALATGLVTCGGVTANYERLNAAQVHTPLLVISKGSLVFQGEQRVALDAERTAKLLALLDPGTDETTPQQPDAP